MPSDNTLPAGAKTIKWVKPEHFVRIAKLEKDEFGEAGWTTDEIKSLLDNNKIFAKAFCVDKAVIGYVFYQVIRTATIINIVVFKKFRRNKIASKLVDSIKLGTIICHVHESNLGTQLFLKKLGFQCVKTIVVNNESFYLFVRRKEDVR